MKNIYLIISFLMFGVSYGQENERIYGQLISGDSLGIERVNVLNFTTNKGTTTNNNGEFAIEVKVGDTLLFSAIQFKNIEFVVTDSIVKEGQILCVLELDDITLQDIVLTDFSMYDTNYADEDVDMSLPFNITPVVRPYSVRKAAYLQGGIISSIVNRLNGSIKKNKKVIAYEKERKEVDRVKMIFDDAFYIKLGIPQNEIFAFVDYYFEEAKDKSYFNPDFKYELIEHIKSCVPLYLESKNIQVDSTNISE